MATVSASSDPVGVDDHPITTALAQHWWATAIRGVLGILFGLIAFVLPGVTLLSLVYVFGAYAIVDGGFAIASAYRAARAHRHWGFLVVEGVAGVAAGAIAWLWPGISVVAFVILIGVYALITGALMFRAAFGLHQKHGGFGMVLGGVCSMVFGGVLIISPIVGAVVVAWWIGVYALFFGFTLCVVAWRLRARKHQMQAVAA